jgi:hypothetical protein
VKKSPGLAAIVLIALGVCHAETRVSPVEGLSPGAAAAYHKLYDHPVAKVVANPEVKIEISSDKIMRSCCAPPNLAIAGNVTNLSAKPIDYLKLLLTFHDDHGTVVFRDVSYNQKAASMGEDPIVAEALNEKPHFEPLPPGSRDSFTFFIPLPEVPRYQSCRLAISEVKRGAPVQTAR